MSALNTNPTVQHADMMAALGNVCFSNAALAIGSTVTQLAYGAISYTIGGVFYSKAATAASGVAVSIASGYGPLQGGAGYVQPVSTTVQYVVSLNSAGTLFVRQGSYSGQVLDSYGSKGDGSIPAIPLTETAIGTLTVTTNASATFTLGTTALNAAGVTVTYTNRSIL